MSTGQSQPRNQPVRGVLERCKNRDTIEIIDVDKEKIDVVIVDAEETCHQVSIGSGTMRRNGCPNGVISIDDEDGCDNDNFRNAHIDATNKEFCSTSNNSPLSEESESGECIMTTRKRNPLFKITEYMRKNHEVGPSVNHFGVGFSSESDSSESDSSDFNSGHISSDNDSNSSDCEIIEDSSGNIREQWERAASRKKMSETWRFGSEQASASGSSCDSGLSPGDETHCRVDGENCMKKIYSDQSKEIPAEFCSNYSSRGKENIHFSIADDDELGDSFCKRNMETDDLDVDAGTNIGHKEPEHRFQSTCENHSDNLGPCFQDPEVLCHKEPEHWLKEPEHWLKEPCENHSDKLGPRFRDPEVLCASVCHMNMHHDPKIQDDSVSSLDQDESVAMAPTFGADGPHGESSLLGKVGPCPAQLSTQNPQPSDGEKFTLDSMVQDNMKHIHGEPSFSMESQCDSHVSPETFGFQEKEKSSFDVPSSCNYHYSDCSLRSVDGETTLNDPSDCNTFKGSKIGLSVPNKVCEDIPQVHSDLICERERHKESDEYRRAVEEEWASRQRQVQIQAEEAQRLKRRKKAETLRLLDMERRQKQRLEEIRESQKKDEDTINLKEHIRTEVRKELDKIELRYRDMTSLLRGLGIHVGGGPFPMPCEVSAAYKQALLKFHPDRASRSDIRQQVKAEEIFKLISRLKEKLLPAM